MAERTTTTTAAPGNPKRAAHRKAVADALAAMSARVRGKDFKDRRALFVAGRRKAAERAKVQRGAAVAKARGRSAANG